MYIGYHLFNNCFVKMSKLKHPTLHIVFYCKTGCLFLKYLTFNKCFSGETGIRTLGARKGTTVFETAPIDHSGISPCDV